MLIKTWAVPMFLQDQANPDGGAGGAGGGAGGDPKTGEGKAGGDDPSQKMIPLSQHKELLDKFHEGNTKLKQLSDELEAIKLKQKSDFEKGAADKGDFKGLYEATKAEAEQLKEQYGKFKQTVFQNEKMRAVEAELRKLGMKQGAEAVMDLADYDMLQPEVTNKGRILIHGADKVAETLKQKYGFAFEGKKVENVNGGGGRDIGGSDPGELTAEYMIDLEVKDPKKYKELYPRFVQQYRERQKGG